jgi:hypothetical protein
MPNFPQDEQEYERWMAGPRELDEIETEIRLEILHAKRREAKRRAQLRDTGVDEDDFINFDDET